jgi:DNA polymerase (family X)
MKSYNAELATAFHEIADLMAIVGENGFKVRAYRSAALRIKEEHPITKKNTDVEKLKEMPRIGDAIAHKIVQYLEVGKIDYLEKLRRQIPKAVRDLLRIPNLGPARVRDLFLMGITSKKEILQAAKEGKIQEMSGFGEKLVEKIVEAMKSGQQKKKRHKRKEIEPIAKKLIKALSVIKGLKKAEAAGSYRRGGKDVGDLDILTVGSKHIGPRIEKQIFKTFSDVKILASGDTKLSFLIMPTNLQVDIRFVPPESYGAALLYFTGSKEFNVMMRKMAIDQGYLLNEYGLFENGEYVAGKTEGEVFEKLGMKLIEPKKRN